MYTEYVDSVLNIFNICWTTKKKTNEKKGETKWKPKIKKGEQSQRKWKIWGNQLILFWAVYLAPSIQQILTIKWTDVDDYINKVMQVSCVLLVLVPEIANAGSMMSERDEHSGEAKVLYSRSWATQRCRKQVLALPCDPYQSSSWIVEVIGRHGWSRCLVNRWERTGARRDGHRASQDGRRALWSHWRQRRVCCHLKSSLTQQLSGLDGGDPRTFPSQSSGEPA